MDIPRSNSGIDALVLEDGRQLIVYNPLGTESRGSNECGVLSLALSSSGNRWERVGDLECNEKGEYNYPAMIQTPDGMVHVTYTWDHRKIKHVVIDPSEL